MEPLQAPDQPPQPADPHERRHRARVKGEEQPRLDAHSGPNPEPPESPRRAKQANRKLAVPNQMPDSGSSHISYRAA